MNNSSSSLVDTLVQATAAVPDTSSIVSVAEKGGGLDFAELLAHMKNSSEIELPLLHDGHFSHWTIPSFPPVTIGGVTFDFSITKHVFFLLLSALFLIVLAVYAARQNKKRPAPRGLGNVLEVFILFLRDEVVVANMGKAGLRYMPYILTTFFFILLMNLAGLIPFGATSTSNISVTGGLALVAFVMIQVAAIRAQGLTHYLAHLTGGVHWTLWPIMIPIEVIGLFTKPFALCVRLFANMTAGHIVILSLIGVIFLFRTFVVAPVPILLALGIMMLELFVAFLQAYIFTMLTALFMGLGIQAGHNEEHAEHAQSTHS